MNCSLHSHPARIVRALERLREPPLGNCHLLRGLPHLCTQLLVGVCSGDGRREDNR